MTTQQSYALYLAYELELGTFVPNVLQNEAALCQCTAAELRTQHARITELESQLAQRFDAADMATAAAQGFRDGVASVSAGSGPAPVPPPECETEAEKRAFAFGWFKALESERMKAGNEKKDPL